MPIIIDETILLTTPGHQGYPRIFAKTSSCFAYAHVLSFFLLILLCLNLTFFYLVSICSVIQLFILAYHKFTSLLCYLNGWNSPLSVQLSCSSFFSFFASEINPVLWDYLHEAALIESRLNSFLFLIRLWLSAIYPSRFLTLTFFPLEIVGLCTSLCAWCVFPPTLLCFYCSFVRKSIN